MGKIFETPQWETEVFAVDPTTPVLGGQPVFNGKFPTAGYANAAIQQLANRTQFLLQQQQENGSDISSLENAVNSVDTDLQNHKQGSFGHQLASATQAGFMSYQDKAKFDSLVDVAYSGDYNDLTNLPYFGYFMPASDFEARCGNKYYIKTNLTVTLGDPAFYGWVDGDYVVLNKSPDAKAFITASGSPQIMTMTYLMKSSFILMEQTGEFNGNLKA
jgi:hypothetical protein